MQFDPNDPYQSMLEWSTKALARKRAGQAPRLQSAGRQLSAGVKQGAPGARRGSRENPWDWWESDGENIAANDFVYERPENAGMDLLGPASRGQKWRTSDTFQRQYTQQGGPQGTGIGVTVPPPAGGGRR